MPHPNKPQALLVLLRFISDQSHSPCPLSHRSRPGCNCRGQNSARRLPGSVLYLGSPLSIFYSTIRVIFFQLSESDQLTHLIATFEKVPLFLDLSSSGIDRLLSTPTTSSRISTPFLPCLLSSLNSSQLFLKYHDFVFTSTFGNILQVPALPGQTTSQLRFIFQNLAKRVPCLGKYLYTL